MMGKLCSSFGSFVFSFYVPQAKHTIHMSVAVQK